MQCTNPMFLKSQGFYVPCGRCLGCKIAHSREWTVRLLHQLSTSDTACFLTLTYDDEHCPMSLSKKELQKFWKRLRKALKKENRNVKYFACGEYGDTYGRPHYHAICFGIDWNDEKIINQCWNKGFIKIGSVTRKSCGYVTDYCLKKYGKQKDKEIYEKVGLEAPFQLCSQGLGLDFAVANRVQLQDNLGCTVNGRPLGLPRYYVRKLEIDTDIMREVAKHSQAEKASVICRRFFKNDSSYNFNMALFDRPLDYFSSGTIKAILADIRRQREINYRAKTRLTKKGEF